MYALEGSIACTGSVVQWLRDNLKVRDGNSRMTSVVLDNVSHVFYTFCIVKHADRSKISFSHPCAVSGAVITYIL